ncbi:MAG: YeeE/YedE family protein, partial [Alphaproteobacteria bacterium]|nr:YeeE/YedE family protein [Alphaproteobacteria bacterium]
LEGSLFRDNITIMNIGIMLGALIAAGLAGRFAPMLKIPLRSLAAALLGGLLMGYGARLAFGCNIGAFFSGAASFSLHAWIWILFAFAGTWVGVKMRPWFGFAD